MAQKQGQMMSVERIYPNPNQPRRVFDAEALQELSDSIRQYGVIEPLVVTPRADRFMIIAGERRYRASLLAELKEVPVNIKEADDALVEELALLENVQRQDLNIMEEAKAYHALLEKGNSIEELSKKLGKPVRVIEKRVSLVNLQEDFQKMTVSGSLNPSEAYHLSRVPAHRQTEVAKRILSGELRSAMNNKIRSFVDSLLRLEDEGTLIAFQLASPEEQKSLSDLESVVRSVERFVGSNSNMDYLRKAVFHTSVTPERLDLIIAALLKIRKAVCTGAGVKSVVGA